MTDKNTHSDEGKNELDPNRDSSRRTFLQSVGLAAVAGVSVPTAVAGETPAVQFVTGNFNDPVDVEAQREARTRAAEQAGAEPRAFGKHGLESPMASYEFQVDEEGNIEQRTSGSQKPLVAYGFVVDETGRTRQVTGIAGDKESVGDVQRDVRERLSQLKKDPSASVTSNNVATSGGEFTTQAGSWQNIHSDADVYQEKPYGKVVNGHDWYELTNDTFDAYVPFAIHAQHDSVPGRVLWDNNWQNFSAYSTHDWSLGDTDRIYDYGPDSGFNTGSSGQSETISLTIDSETVEWEDWYIANVDVQDNTEPSSQKAKWKMNFVGSAQDTKSNWQPGSAVLIPDQDDGSEKVVDLVTRTEFIQDGTYEGYGLKYTYGLVYNY